MCVCVCVCVWHLANVFSLSLGGARLKLAVTDCFVCLSEYL